MTNEQVQGSDAAPRLWVCHTCNMIGEDSDAERHVELKGHRVVQLTQSLSDSIRAEWVETGDSRAAYPREETTG